MIWSLNGVGDSCSAYTTQADRQPEATRGNQIHQMETVEVEVAYRVSVRILRGAPMASIRAVVKRRLGACMAAVGVHGGQSIEPKGQTDN